MILLQERIFSANTALRFRQALSLVLSGIALNACGGNEPTGTQTGDPSTSTGGISSTGGAGATDGMTGGSGGTMGSTGGASSTGGMPSMTGGSNSGGGGGGGVATGGTGGMEPALDCPDPPDVTTGYTLDDRGLSLQVASKFIRVEVCRSDVIHVELADSEQALEKDSLIVNKEWAVPDFCVEETDTEVVLTTYRMKVRVELSTGLVVYTDLDDQVVLAEDSKQLTPAMVEGDSTNHVETTFASPQDEALLGLGQHQDSRVNRKGSNRNLVNNNTEIALPFLASSRGYGLLWDNVSGADFYGGEEGNTKYKYVSETGDLVDYYFFFGPSMDEVIRGYRIATGAAPLFPKWAYGLFQSKDKYESQAELLAVKDGYRNNNIPVDVIVQDWDYWNPSVWGSHYMSASRYPNPKALVDEMHQDHIHTMISIWPVYATANSEAVAGELDNYKALDAIGALFSSGGNHHFYDVFNPDARTLVYQQIDDRLIGKFGWDAIWADNTEPQAFPDPFNRRAVETKLGKNVHVINAYPLEHSRALYEGWRSVGPTEKRIYILNRSGYAGQQRFGTTSWSGDIDCDFATLKKQLPAGLGFTISGLPYWTTDIGGYWGHPGRKDWTTAESNELFTRWFQYGAFNPIFRVHGGGSRELYNTQWSATTKANLLVIDELRYRLMPYIYSLAWKVTHEGYTTMRHLIFDYPDDAQVYDIGDQFLFGPAILVNPVTEAGATSRSAYLPAGKWYDFWTGKSMDGGNTQTLDAPLDKIPLLIKAGSILPLGPKIQYASESNDPIELRVYGGADGSFTLYEDADDTYSYEQGEYSTIALSWDDAAKKLTIGARRGSFPGMTVAHSFHIVWVGESHGTGVEPTPSADVTVDYDGTEVVVAAPL